MDEELEAVVMPDGPVTFEQYKTRILHALDVVEEQIGDPTATAEDSEWHETLEAILFGA